MARITRFEEGDRDRDRYAIHDGIEAKYFVFERDGKRLFQIDTHGRKSREIPGKVSQSIQLDQTAAKQLVTILSKAFDI